jgi:hypothetical protein
MDASDARLALRAWFGAVEKFLIAFLDANKLIARFALWRLSALFVVVRRWICLPLDVRLGSGICESQFLSLSLGQFTRVHSAQRGDALDVLDITIAAACAGHLCGIRHLARLGRVNVLFVGVSACS